MTHTPGPWRADHHLVWADELPRAPLVEPAGKTIEEMEANAKLIAQAPAMLKALKGLMAHFDSPYNEMRSVPCGDGWLEVDEARQVIEDAS